MTQVLVLNQDYQAVSICDVERAVVLLFGRKAELVADKADCRLRSARQTFAYPSVIRLLAYVHLPYRKVALTRANIFRRDGNRCAYCGSKDNLTLDHVIPRAQGGRHTWGNLVTACQTCNNCKADRSPEAAGMTLLTQPYRPGFLMFTGLTTRDETWRPFLYLD
ncbi:MAG: HNH endonuclease [Bacteroidia bacterium]